MKWIPILRSSRAQSRGVGARASRLRAIALRSIRTVLVGLVVFVSAPVIADSSLPPSEWADKQLPDASQEEAARELMEEIRCLVCQGQSIADSDAEMAGDMRALIRTRVADGEDPEAIRAWLVERYGNWVTFDPPVEPLTWPLWIAPLLLLAIGGFIAARKLKGKSE